MQMGDVELTAGGVWQALVVFLQNLVETLQKVTEKQGRSTLFLEKNYIVNTTQDTTNALNNQTSVASGTALLVGGSLHV